MTFSQVTAGVKTCHTPDVSECVISMTRGRDEGLVFIRPPPAYLSAQVKAQSSCSVLRGPASQPPHYSSFHWTQLIYSSELRLCLFRVGVFIITKGNGRVCAALADILCSFCSGSLALRRNAAPLVLRGQPCSFVRAVSNSTPRRCESTGYDCGMSPSPSQPALSG